MTFLKEVILRFNMLKEHLLYFSTSSQTLKAFTLGMVAYASEIEGLWQEDFCEFKASLDYTTTP